jgi:hypothetical protein
MESAENREQSSQVNQPPESNDSPSLSKIETIKLLNDSIDRLESTIKEISQNSAKKLPSSDSINNLINTTQELADSVVPPPTIKTVVEETASEEIKPIPAAKVKPTPPPNPQPKKTPVKLNTQAIAKNKQKQNRSLIMIGVIAIAIFAIAIIWLYLPQIKATFVPSPSVEAPKVVIEREIQPLPEAVDIPVSDPQSSSDQTKTTEVNIEPETPELIPIPQDLTSPGRVKNLKVKTIEPELTFTPEQSLVAALQTKLAEITANYDSDLFKTIQVDLPANSLAIAITDGWYKLNESSQNKLANEILQRSRQLNFKKLQLQDAQGTVVARNPVVGDRVIIIQSDRNN